MDRALNRASTEEWVTTSMQKGAAEMQNPDLTTWLEMVWDALNQEDERKRDGLLHAADAFLQSDNQLPDSTLPFVDREITAA
jgi:hypothetical protein